MDERTPTSLRVWHNQNGDRELVLVKLSGELDIQYQKILKNILSDCLASERSALVDLSRVTFMDSLCARELVVHYQLGKGSMALCDPSWEVELSVAACDQEKWIDFFYTNHHASPQQASPISWQRSSKKGTCS